MMSVHSVAEVTWQYNGISPNLSLYLPFGVFHKVVDVSFSENGSTIITVGIRHVKFWYLDAAKSRVRHRRYLTRLVPWRLIVLFIQNPLSRYYHLAV